jgi:hypothetical protein
MKESSGATARRLAVVASLLITACLPAVRRVLGAGRLADVAGTWVEVVNATPEDTVVWRLDPNGADWKLLVRVVRDGAGHISTNQTVKRNGYWYLRGALTDTAERALCFKARPRDGETCFKFDLDSVGYSERAARVQRRMVLLAYRGLQYTGDRVLLERFP